MAALSFLEQMAKSDSEFLQQQTQSSFAHFKAQLAGLGFIKSHSDNPRTPISIETPPVSNLATTTSLSFNTSNFSKIDQWQQHQDELARQCQLYPRPYMPTYPVRQRVDLKSRLEFSMQSKPFILESPRLRASSFKSLSALHQDSQSVLFDDFGDSKENAVKSKKKEGKDGDEKGKDGAKKKKEEGGKKDESPKKKSNLKTKESKEALKPKKSVQIKDKSEKAKGGSPTKGVKTVDQFIESPKSDKKKK